MPRSYSCEFSQSRLDGHNSPVEKFQPLTNYTLSSSPCRRVSFAARPPSFHPPLPKLLWVLSKQAPACIPIELRLAPECFAFFHRHNPVLYSAHEVQSPTRKPP